MRFRPVLALLSIGTSASAGHLVAVRAIPGAEATVVQLDADAPPSFTTLKLNGPPRVVVDLADTSVTGAAPQQEVGDGVVRRIAVAEAGARTTRVVIELAEDAEFDVRASQTRVEVRIPRAVVLAASEPASGAAPTAKVAEADGKAPDPAPAAVQEPEPKAIPEVDERAALPTVALVGSEKPVGKPAARAAPSRAPAPRSEAQVHISGIGFRPLGGGEVIVRSDRPVEYEVSSAEAAVLIHLRSARIPLQNNRRPLDTRFFDGPIERIVPLHVPSGTDIRIELRQRAQVHLTQSGPLLTVSFTPRS
ncbi:MAG TPA: AMIN domain-containing protein [Myxococcales bacterium]|nr:AMIN domain-containing protein [Myxococcales bacterium]